MMQTLCLFLQRKNCERPQHALSPLGRRSSAQGDGTGSWLRFPQLCWWVSTAREKGCSLSKHFCLGFRSVTAIRSEAAGAGSTPLVGVAVRCTAHAKQPPRQRSAGRTLSPADHPPDGGGFMLLLVFGNRHLNCPGLELNGMDSLKQNIFLFKNNGRLSPAIS